MDNNSTPNVARVSALASHYRPVSAANAGVILTEVENLTLWQLATWPETIQRVAQNVAAQLSVPAVPGFGQAVSHNSISMLRIEPLKFWVIGSALTEIDANDGVVIDLSHSRTHIRITGDRAVTLLNSYLPLDLREQSFPPGSVASSAFHHIGVTLWRSDAGYELFVPRGFAVSLWELLVESATQYELSVV